MKGHYKDKILITSGFYSGYTGIIKDYDFWIGYTVALDSDDIFKQITFLRSWNFKVYYTTKDEDVFKRGYEQGFNDHKKIRGKKK